MSRRLFARIDKLKSIANRYDEESRKLKQELLLKLFAEQLPLNKRLTGYFNLLLYLCSHPDDKGLLLLAEKELDRLASFLKKSKNGGSELFINSGMPYTTCRSSFSHDCMNWLLKNPFLKITIDSYVEPVFKMNEVLKLTLPTMEKSETAFGLDNEGLLESLLVKKNDRLPFIITELSKMNKAPFVKDHFYEGLGIYTDIILTDKSYSRASNRIRQRTKFFHHDLIRHFDPQRLFNSPLPPPAEWSVTEREAVVQVIKKSLVLTDRETDPVTYMDENSLRLFELERGISIAIYGMVPERQLPLESYVGYTLFKNGFPAAYGGGWVFGAYADIGINIFEPFRGGESGYLLSQVLRVYRQVFKINCFEVEPYQFGLNNPEGIESGAFWFYYRLGFRPLDGKLLKTAAEEQKKIKSRKGYRTGKATLKKFTQSPVALKFDESKPRKVGDITQRVTQLIAGRYHGNRTIAVQDSIRKFREKTRLPVELPDREWKVLEETALWAEALKIKQPELLKLMVQMIQAKPHDMVHYQELLLFFFKNRHSRL